MLIVAGSMALLKVALTAWLIPTPVAPFAGTVEVIVGGAASAAVPVVKVHGFGTGNETPLTSALPARS